ncbi:guanylate kinase [Candidatus Williamhamiltonella defendens]|uniref:Guanylate kinase n=1 Tax=Candidatus Williamhamiltonella defendens TaxID=138072 RepID=A0A2D3T6Z4_9ENTR|nr:guanylate kinase [Candidatus Hamiltonella defensa]ASV33444.1 guanylate kinase [Candidatus Hamiltonella defensa]ATW29604.1 guanylate kinase [Candidatus Hamiltonella defensa]ATW31582.1 guanylate kinase [Candidatus Hamiltonella defensa]AWK16390.1 guanylate kinase [Candidatus Hamiltonella defensa]AYB48389.1 guanylate kinase [Candidatus Hamiltonella defensa]
MEGTLYIISAPSGAGKSSLIQAFLKTSPSCEIKVSISYTTRAKRSTEKHGEHYFFVSDKEFRQLIKEDAFLEYAQVFGYYYGTSRSFIEAILSNGRDVFLDIDWQGARQIRAKMPKARSIFILPPSKEALMHRLQSRQQDAQQFIDQRMAQAVMEMAHFIEYDYLIVNDDFEQALLDIKNIIYGERLHLKKQQERHHNLISKLLLEHPHKV